MHKKRGKEEEKIVTYHTEQWSYDAGTGNRNVSDKGGRRV